MTKINAKFTQNKARALRFAPHAATWAVQALENAGFGAARGEWNTDGTYFVWVGSVLVSDIWETHY